MSSLINFMLSVYLQPVGCCTEVPRLYSAIYRENISLGLKKLAAINRGGFVTTVCYTVAHEEENTATGILP